MRATRSLEFLLGSLWMGVCTPTFAGCQSSGSSEHATPATTPKTLVVDELVVKRLRVVDEDGSDRVVMANATRFPKPRLGGTDYPRSIDPAGMVFYRDNGDECGGVVVLDTPEGTGNMVILDYANNDAIGFGVREAAGGQYSAGISISDRPPLDADPMRAASLVRQRLAIGNTDGRTQIVLADPEGRARIEIVVDEAGVPALRILDEAGQTVFEVP